LPVGTERQREGIDSRRTDSFAQPVGTAAMAQSGRVQQWVTKAFEYSFPSVAAVKEELQYE